MEWVTLTVWLRSGVAHRMPVPAGQAEALLAHFADPANHVGGELVLHPGGGGPVSVDYVDIDRITAGR